MAGVREASLFIREKALKGALVTSTAMSHLGKVIDRHALIV